MLKIVRLGGLTFTILIAVLIIPLWIGTLWGSGETGPEEKDGVGLLEIRMEGMEKTPKMPPVPFPHDAHTERIKDKDCDICHLKKEGDFVFEFKNAGGLEYDAAMALFHDECAGCHKKMEAGGDESGPQLSSCRECHRQGRIPAPAWQLIAFDRSLHYRHVKSAEIKFIPQVYDANCGACHHVYDEQLKKTVYKKGEEGSCRYCHQAVQADDARAWSNAAHAQCVNCHLGKQKQDREAGPVKCDGCHSSAEQAKIDRIEEIPRMEWKQPDAVLLVPWLEEAVKAQKLPEHLTWPVAFNHKQHEEVSETCRQCHHASMEPCAKCHTTRGIKEGDFIPLETAMHDKQSAISCAGCHADAMAETECAGCHARMADRPFADMACRRCHSIDPLQLQLLPVEDRKRIAVEAVAGRDLTPRRVPEKDIPDKVKIDIMADEYQATEMPHRKIILALAEKTKESRLAVWFHDKPETLCMGCHHNSPASLKPPRCVSCHKLAASGTAGDRPGLKGAYHGQCIGCHTQMNIEKPSANDCQGCHKLETGDRKPETRNTGTL